ncbi:MAG: hypothetical protein ABSD59_09300 [Terracidiphilus sp.]|jgi:hypothetical protein
MTNESNSNLHAAGLPAGQVEPKAPRAALMKLPGLIAISLYMLLLAIVVVVFVVQGRVGPLFLVFPVLFIAAAFGLMMLLRWAWALTLAAVALLAGSFFWACVSQHMPQFLLQGLLNLVFFLYLVRTEVREKLR